MINRFLKPVDYRLSKSLEIEFQDKTNEQTNHVVKIGIPIISIFIWFLYFAYANTTLGANLFNFVACAQFVLILALFSVYTNGKFRRGLNYFTFLLPMAYVAGLMSLHIPRLPDQLTMAQAQNWMVWLIFFLYAVERVSPVIALLNAGTPTILFFVLRSQISELSSLSSFQLFWLLAASHLAGIVICFEHCRTARKKFKFEKELEAARFQSDALLYNVLPETVVEELKTRGNGRIAHQYNEVSVIFIDLVGFTKKSASMEAERLVTLLDELFSRFDELAARFGVEKIKTIGDAYMAATGCPKADPEHAHRIVDFALQLDGVMTSFNRDYVTDFRIKIGISSGVVMGGVIGKKRVSFDIWGDTVNLASRIEAIAKPGEISICEATAGLVLDRFYLSKGRIVDLKGKGSTLVYSVLKSKASSADEQPILAGKNLTSHISAVNQRGLPASKGKVA